MAVLININGSVENIKPKYKIFINTEMALYIQVSTFKILRIRKRNYPVDSSFVYPEYIVYTNSFIGGEGYQDYNYNISEYLYEEKWVYGPFIVLSEEEGEDYFIAHGMIWVG